MPHYVMLMRYRSHGVKEVRSNPSVLLAANEALERWEGKILHCYHLLGEWDQCAIVEAPDNFKAYRASIAHEISTTADIDILPAIDLPLFQRLMSQDARIAGPHPWQIQPWAKIARRAMRRRLAERLAESAVPALVITHDVHDIVALNADVHVMEEGRIVQRGRAEALAIHPATEFVAEVFGSPLATRRRRHSG